MNLIFESKHIVSLAERYLENKPNKDGPIKAMHTAISEQGFLTKNQLIPVCEWKSPRIRKHIAQNEDGFVKEVTKAAFSSKHPAFQIEVLTLLKGVSWPTASVILHFFFPEPFPILDFRALYSVNCAHIQPKDYNYQFWQEYVGFFRQVLAEANVDKRTLDRALWQYSKEKQKIV